MTARRIWILSCDGEGCGERFTASARTETITLHAAAAEGWLRTYGSTRRKTDGHALTGHARDWCPTCKTKTVYR